MDTTFIDIAWRGRRVRIEHQRIAPERRAAPLMVFLHEGLGSVSMWRGFPTRLCQALGWRGLVYSRPGYGRSTPREADERWGLDFMHQQADELLPALLAALGLATAHNPPWLLGHSDGASIALLHAAHFAGQVAGVVVLAPHVRVEPVAITRIEAARQAYLHADLSQGLARHHDQPDSAFWGWNQAWLDPAFRAWTIEAEIASIACPLLAIQGRDDEYGTLDQIHSLQRLLPHARLLALPDCGHSPQRDQPDAVIAAVCAWAQAAGC